MLNRKESLCLFLVSVLLFSSFYSSSFSWIGRVTNIHRAYAQPIMGIQQQQQLQLRQRQQLIPTLPPIGNIPQQQQQQQIRGAQPYPDAGSSIISPYPPNQPALQQLQQQPSMQQQQGRAAPISNAGKSQSVYEGTTVMLDGPKAMILILAALL